MKSFKAINDEAIQYVENIQNGINLDENFNNLKTAFEPITKKIVKNVKHNGYIERDDLEQEAMIALWKCCYKYDLDSKATFYSYYYSCATNALNEYVYKYQTPITMTRHEQDRTSTLRYFAKEYFELHGEYPTVEEYESLGVSKKLIKRFADYLLNMNCPGSGLDGIEITETENLSVEEEAERNDIYEELYKAIDSLEEKYKQVIKLRFFEELTFLAMAQKTGTGKTTMIRLTREAIEILKNCLNGFEY